MNLNHLRIQDDSRQSQGTDDPTLRIPVRSADMICYMRDLERHLLHHIRAADAVVGCVAWLTHPGILEGLAQRPHGVNLVVQKEDFLRPDLGQGNWAARLRRLYEALRPATDRQSGDDVRVTGMSCCVDPSIAPIRCMGNYNAEKHPAFPRMHHKFLVFCTKYLPPHVEESTHRLMEEEDYARLLPYAVWTGSFNMTVNATQSFENALYITSPPLVQRYFEEWGWIEALSEPLDWTTEWVAPEWRIGT